MSKVLIYGAYGYTGKLIVEEALRQGLKPIISGRNAEKLAQLAEQHSLQAHPVDLGDTKNLHELLAKVDVVIHCAGPFIHTAKQMASACLATKTHYLDITGEYQVFELLKGMSSEAQAAGIMLLPGAGFDVVPSDCLAAKLKAALPSATHLELAFTGLGGSLSRGTAKTLVENAHEGQWYRKDGELKSKGMGQSTKKIDFGEFEQLCVGISWGDISTAYYSTQIQNIEVFVGSTEKQVDKLKWMGRLKFILSWSFVKSFMKKQIDKKKAGPSEARRAKSSMHLWGRVSEGANQVEARLTCSNGYTLTAQSAVLITLKILSGDFKSGFQTPSTAYGQELIIELPGSNWLD